MKKIVFSMTLLVFIASFVSCKSSGDSFEKDVRKRADFMCKAQQLTAKAATDEAAAQELEKVQKEMNEFDEAMEKKYENKKADADMTAKAEKIMKEVMDKCK